MAKLAPPILFSDYFQVDEARLNQLGVFNPTLNVDSKLFPDPLLLDKSSHPEMQAARKKFDKYFEQLMAMLHGIRTENDKPWRTAYQKLVFGEVPGTCLGFGAGTISGRGSGPKMAGRLLATGRDVVRLGIDDPDLFMAMGLFEEDFGPDLIGDMLTNIAIAEFGSFNERVVSELKLPHEQFKFKLNNGTRFEGNFIVNPVVGAGDVPIILMPLDILRALPVATDWSEVQRVSEENNEFREGLNGSIAALWSKRTLESKAALRNWALSNREAFGNLLDMLHGHDGKPYDFVGDPHGELIWRDIGRRVVDHNPLALAKPEAYDQKGVLAVVDKIVEQFKFLIEDRDLWKDLYSGSKPRFENASQRMFYVVAYSYCVANDIDITPEAETGRGPVDFKLSSGISSRVLVEIKLSTNSKVVQGYERQLAAYDAAELPIESYYVVLDVGGMGEKYEKLLAHRNARIETGNSAPRIVVIDGNSKRSASKL